MVAGSHDPPDYDGLKIVIAATRCPAPTSRRCGRAIERGDLAQGAGSYRAEDIAGAYVDRIVGGITLARPMAIAIDAGNGVAGAFAPELFRRLGCKVTPMYCDVDGTFPNHHPDPSQPKNLADLIARVRDDGLELGLAFDGDGDRLGVVTKDGHVIYPDRQLMLFAADVLDRVPGATIIFDVKSTRNLGPWVTRHGGKPLLWKTGHSLIKVKMKEVGAALAGEMSGHTFFKERWYGFDDGLYAGARLLEILSRHADPSAVLDGLPDAISTPELNVACAEGEHHKLRRAPRREREVPRGHRGHPDRRIARRVSRRLRTRPRIEHHPGRGAALRGGQRRRPRADQGRVPSRAGRGAARPRASVLTVAPRRRPGRPPRRPRP